jgi:hypothetical protein
MTGDCNTNRRRRERKSPACRGEGSAVGPLLFARALPLRCAASAVLTTYGERSLATTRLKARFNHVPIVLLERLLHTANSPTSFVEGVLHRQYQHRGAPPPPPQQDTKSASKWIGYPCGPSSVNSVLLRRTSWYSHRMAFESLCYRSGIRLCVICDLRSALGNIFCNSRMSLVLPCMRVGAATPRLAEAPARDGLLCSYNAARGALLRESLAVIKHSQHSQQLSTLAAG